MASWNQWKGDPQHNFRMNSNEPSSLPHQQWDPAALLNPRGVNQGGARAQDPHSNTTTYNPRATSGHMNNGNAASNLSFQFDSPGGSPIPPPPAHPLPQQFTYDNASFNGTTGNGFASYANGNGMMQGMGDMLERMHGVQNRDMQPQKRRKIYDERVYENKAQFNGGGKGGVLGDYMREKREEGRKEATANGTRPPIEILDDDDDDVQIVNPEDVEVCYGRIEGVEVNAHRVPTPREGSKAIQPGFWPQIKVHLRRRTGERGTNIIHVVDFTREIFGTIDVNTARGLAPLMDQGAFGLRTQGRILSRAKRESDPEPGTPGISLRYSLDLNIYGPRKFGLQIGRHLSQKNLFLRTPLLLESGKELDNPHLKEKPPQPPPRATLSYSYRQQGPARSTEEIRNDVLGMFDSLERSDKLPELEPDPRVLTELLRHQKQGLNFMINKETVVKPGSEDSVLNTSLWKPMITGNGSKTYLNVITGEEQRSLPKQVLGGILADMMGLGKTLSILSLIVQTLDNESLEWAKLPPCNSAINKDLCSSKKKGKGAQTVIEQTPVVLNAKTTLLVSPLSIIANWEEQIKQHIEPGTLKYHIFHGSNRIKDIRKLAEYDLVFTTYGTVASEFAQRSKQKNGVFPLEEINWFRIVLDEAHMIREQSTLQSKAICRLPASRRWAVTGTPVQNRLEDLGALMTFLRIKPFDERGGFAQHIMSPFKLCDPSILPKLRLLVDSITLRRLKDRIDLPARYDHLVKLDFSNEEQKVYDVFAKNAQDRANVILKGRDNKLSGKSYVHILQSILRLRLICAHGRDLLGEEDLKVMQGHDKHTAIDLSDDDDDGPGLTPKQAYDMYNLLKETNADNCLTCRVKIGPNDVVDADGEPKDEVIGYMTPCFHIICPVCIDKYRADVVVYAGGNSEATCPICQQWIKLSYFPMRQGAVEDEDDSRSKSNTKVKPERTRDAYTGRHTKTQALICDLVASRNESATLPPELPIKSVVFSGWTAHLDLIQFALDQERINYVRLDGKMSRTARGAALKKFREDPSVIVILVSITAGGLGLNLTTANKVYVMEPQYNPAAEAQAVDRVHRLGQKREVQTVRYIMNDSFEEKMLLLQDKKKKLASLSMDRDGKGRMDKEEAARKRLEDLRSLFK